MCFVFLQIDLNLLRVDRGENPEVVRKSEIRRQRDGKIVDEVRPVNKRVCVAKLLPKLAVPV